MTEVTETSSGYKGVTFSTTVWKQQVSGTWNKILLKSDLCEDGELTPWEMMRILKKNISEKEYFKRKLSGKT